MKVEKMSFEEAKARLLEALYDHVGEEHAIGMDALHELVFDESVSHKINHTRKLRKLIKALRRQGKPIGSISTSDGGGYYLIRVPSELDDFCKRVYRRPALNKLAEEAKMRGIALPDLLGQMVFNIRSQNSEDRSQEHGDKDNT